ncbi:peptide antibiotic transporter SbmA [Parathalassolituus penaei]|uniref:Peptide antibiotic transporter SbmA n=1 Tax=Parathalassolituus penaei TaxID=2997323 RepID=A0A9X3EE73_9GAMM|nr:peptide antibiotic transporter SbmA [Parathalassolituus penaei]MCY0965065.1 peptide antibiotic transporter SbmA [Parathalassolituus penaei]
MFVSFFMRPGWFFLSFALWALLCIGGWYGYFADQGATFSIGVSFPQALAATADEAAQAAFATAQSEASEFWFYQYMLVGYAVFVGVWLWLARDQRWSRWSIAGSALIVFITWFQVQVSVMLNEWYGGFYDLIQNALGNPGKVSIGEYYSELSTVAVIIMTAVAVSVFNRFFVSHYVFRWRHAMNDYYTSRWGQLRQIEGASQRIQEDTMRFATIVEDLGVSFLESVMTLLAFLPILWGLSAYVTELPLIGEVPQALVMVALVWSIVGTALLALAGIKLPGLEFNNQKVEAAYRKELVYGEDHEHRAHPQTLSELFADVRANYFRLYRNYLYFNVVRYGYLNVGQFVPLIALAPAIMAGAFTLGIMQRILNAFRQVQDSFQYLVNSWTTIVELQSIYKRLRAFERTLQEREAAQVNAEQLQGRSL